MSQQKSDRRVQPFVDVDQARERPERLEDLENQPDVGATSDDFTDTSAHVEYEDEADVVPGEKTDIYQRGVTIMPPG